jgi:uncharacterized protein (DUF885 family)
VTTPQPDIDGFLRWFFDQHPARAAADGSLEHDHTFGDFSADSFLATQRESDEWLAAFDGLLAGRAVGSLDDEIDLRLVRTTLRRSQIMADWPSWRRDPTGYTSTVLGGLFATVTHQLRDEAGLVSSIRSRLAEVPALLQACRANLDPELAAPLLARRGREQARAGAGFLTDTLPAGFSDPARRRAVAEAAAPAAEAFRTLAEFLSEFEERARGDWRMGEKRYSMLLREVELLGYGADELRERGRQACDELNAQMTEVAGRIEPGAGSWQQVMAELARDAPPAPEAMREEYQAETERARRFVAERELVSFAPGERCEVIPAPSFQRPILAVAAYLHPPVLASGRVGHFFVPYPPEHFDAEQVTQRLRSNSRAEMPTVAVHETYPGHHWHFSWLAAQPRTVRQLFGTSYFAEGWGLYAERMLAEQGYFTDPRHQLGHFAARIFRAARIVVDTELHCREMTTEQAREFMVSRAALTEGTAAGEVDRYCSWPTQAPSYLTGSLEIERIRDDYMARDLGDLRTFHDTLAGSGFLPLGLARQAVLDEREE